MRCVGRLAQGALMLGWAWLKLGLGFDLARLALTELAILGCASLFYGLSVLGGMMSFWTTETLEILNCLTHGGNFAGQYPISIYRESFRRFFTWIVPSHASPTIPPSPSSAVPTRQSWSAGWPRWQASPSSPSASACGVSA